MVSGQQGSTRTISVSSQKRAGSSSAASDVASALDPGAQKVLARR
jgi:hypothetical protein